MRIGIIVFSIIGLFFQVSAEAESKEYKIRWMLAHQPARVFERAAKNFAGEVEKNSQGRIKVEILGVAENGRGDGLNPYEAFTQVQKGDIEMVQTYTTYLGRHHKDLWALDLPYLFRDHAHAAKVLDGKTGEKLLAGLSKSGVKGLAFTYSGGYRIIPTKDKPIATSKDFEGMKIKVSESPVAASYLTELKANPILAKDDEHYAKGLDGFETTYARLENVEGDASQYINETEHSLFLTSILVNKKFYENLPKDLQKIVKDAVAKAAKLEREDSIRDGNDSREEYRKKGLKIVSLPAAEKAKLQQAAQRVHKKYSGYFSGELISEIKRQ